MANNTTAIVLGITGGVAILTIGGYFIYKSSQEKAAAQAEAAARQRQLDMQMQLQLQQMMNQGGGYQQPQNDNSTTNALINAGASIFTTLFGGKKTQEYTYDGWNYGGNEYGELVEDTYQTNIDTGYLDERTITDTSLPSWAIR